MVVANRYTAKTAREAQKTTAQTELAKLDIQRIQDWRADNQALRQQRIEDKHEFDKEIGEMKARLGDLEVENRQARTERIAFVSWARSIVLVLQDRQIPYPPPPVGVLDTGLNPGA